MKTVRNLGGLREEKRPLVLAAGFFDGLHRGHRKVIDKTSSRAKEIRGSAWVLTFDTHPARVLRPGSGPPLLTANRHKLTLLERMDLDGAVMMPFNRQVAKLRAETFVRNLLESAPTLREIVVGGNWRFGAGGEGDALLLSTLAEKQGIAVTSVRPVTRGGSAISSTRIRAEIARGNLDEAEIMLGRPFDILGTVTRGRTIGRKLGFPTANLDPHNEVLPPFGVYAVYALLEPAGLVGGLVNIGVRPTVSGKGGRKSVVELHALDTVADLYGQDIEVFFIARLRDEKRFANRNELAKQIAEDVARTRKLLAGKKGKESLYTVSGSVL